MWTRMPIRPLTLALLSATALLHAQDRLPTPVSHQNRPPDFVLPSATTNSTVPATATPPTPSVLPATPATAEVPPADTPSAQAAPPTPAQGPAHRATISNADGQITVSASNSSLNQILRDISRSTGIKITGGVLDERVFGDYGPAPASQVLASLLDGAGSNMLLIQGMDGRASELILTPRTGGPTPPNPNSASFDSNDDSDDAAPRHVASPPPPNSQYQPSVAGPPPPQNADGSTPPAPASGDATQESPTGVKTPQQIYDQLMRMRAQQQQQGPQ